MQFVQKENQHKNGHTHNIQLGGGHRNFLQ